MNLRERGRGESWVQSGSQNGFSASPPLSISSYQHLSLAHFRPVWSGSKDVSPLHIVTRCPPPSGTAEFRAETVQSGPLPSTPHTLLPRHWAHARRKAGGAQDGGRDAAETSCTRSLQFALPHRGSRRCPLRREERSASRIACRRLSDHSSSYLYDAATFFSDVCQQIFPGVFANAAAMVTAIVSISEMQGGNGNK